MGITCASLILGSARAARLPLLLCCAGLRAAAAPAPAAAAAHRWYVQPSREVPRSSLCAWLSTVMWSMLLGSSSTCAARETGWMSPRMDVFGGGTARRNAVLPAPVAASASHLDVLLVDTGHVRLDLDRLVVLPDVGAARAWPNGVRGVAELERNPRDYAGAERCGSPVAQASPPCRGLSSREIKI
jgi:hypothetical protein